MCSVRVDYSVMAKTLRTEWEVRISLVSLRLNATDVYTLHVLHTPQDRLCFMVGQYALPGKPVCSGCAQHPGRLQTGMISQGQSGGGLTLSSLGNLFSTSQAGPMRLG